MGGNRCREGVAETSYGRLKEEGRPSGTAEETTREVS
jgi:hypothetical protein